MKVAKIVAVLAALAGLTLTSCGSKPEPMAPAPVPSVTIGK
ncbi:hypothetical protein [Roseibacillus persicicus]|nr:hypothetical protein [Roseibacillus persicicus]MDQ8190523.1 hypothetical protein [Roseibacillus persicicus]